MAKYKITIKQSAAKELDDIGKKDLRTIVKCIQSLAQNPGPHGSQKLSAKARFRVRQGDYRIIYALDDRELVIDIVKIGHRREIYRL